MRPVATAQVEQVRSLSADEASRAASMLAESYVDNPLFLAAFPDANRRKRAGAAIFTAVLRDGLPFGTVYVVRDPDIIALLVIYPPGMHPLSLRRKLRIWREYASLARAGLTGCMKILRAEATLAALRPSDPHLYGYFGGVWMQRQGIAGPLLAKQLIAESEKRGLPVYGETQDRRIVQWYRRLGARVLNDGVPLYEGGPPTWTVWREPATAQ